MDWFVYALVATIFSVACNLLIKKCLQQKTGDARAFTFWMDFFTVIFIWVISFFEERYYLHFKFLHILIFILVSLVYSFSDLIFVKARHLEEISKVSVANQIGPIWALIAGIIFFQEPVFGRKILGVLLIIGANILLFWNHKKITLTKGVRLAFLGAFLSVNAALIDKFMVSNFISPAFYKTILGFSITSWIFALMPRRIKRIKKELRLQKARFIFIGALGSISVFSLIKALQIGEASRIIPIFSFSNVLIVLGGIMFFKERTQLKKKFLAAILAFLGVILLKA